MDRCRFLGLVFICSCWSCWASTSKPYVFGRADFPTGNLPYAIVSADFNRDGILDIAVANYADDTVSTYFGNRDGSFIHGADYPVGVNPDAIVAGDFNGDGSPDIAVTNQNCNNTCGPGSISVLLSRGDGTFHPAIAYTTDTDPVSIIAADFNGDGTLDLAAANAISTVQRVPGEVSIFLNNGDGTFKLSGKYPAGPAVGQIVALKLAAADKPSIAALNFVSLRGVNAVSILRNKGDGTLGFPVSYRTGLGPVSIVSADFNQDGNADLAIANKADNTISVLLGRSDGTFSSRVDYSVPSGPNGLTVCDLNADGKLDLIAGASTTYSGGGAVAVLLGRSDGTFATSVSYGTGNNPFSLISGDFDRDGKADVAFTNGDVNRFSVLLGNGDGTFPTFQTYAAGYQPVAAGAADLNGDGYLDLVVANYGSNSVSVLFGTADGRLIRHASYAVGRNPRAVAIADLNGDGKPDIVIANSADNTVSILLNEGVMGFGPTKTLPVGAAPGGISIADFNGDRMPDLAITNTGDNTVSILLNLGNNTFAPAISYATGPGPTSVVAADFNGDGKPDLAIADSQLSPRLEPSGSITVLLNRGDGTFQAGVKYDTGPNPMALVTGDFNNDGKLDLAVAANVDTVGMTSIFLGNGDGGFQRSADYLEGFGITALALADFNGDGRADLAVVSNLNQTVFLLKGVGDGAFQVQGTYGTSLSPIAALAGIFTPSADLSGAADLVVIDFDSAAVSLFPNK